MNHGVWGEELLLLFLLLLGIDTTFGKHKRGANSTSPLLPSHCFPDYYLEVWKEQQSKLQPGSSFSVLPQHAHTPGVGPEPR